MTPAERKITKQRTKMLLNHPFWGNLTLQLDRKVDPTCKTLATDGKSMFYNPEYVEKREDWKLMVDMCSLVSHINLGHIWRREGRDFGKWNAAADFAANAMLKTAGLTLPDDYLVSPLFQNNSSEQIFNLLPDGDGDGGQGDGGDQQREEGDYGPGEVRDDPEPDKATENQAAWETAVRQAAQTAKAMGKLPGSLETLVNEVLAPPCDWKSFTRRFVQETASADYSWKRLNKKYVHGGVYLPSLRSEQMPPIVIGFDTSASISQSQIDDFCALINDIIVEAKPEFTTVIACDSRVHSVQEFMPDEPVVLEVKGRAGTDLREIFLRVEKDGIEPACILVLTDLETPFPDEPPQAPTLWISTKKHVAPFGETIYLEGD